MTPLQQGSATPRRLWIHVGDERWLGELVVAWPEAGQGLLVVGAQRQSSVLAKREAALAAPRNDYDPLYVSRWWHILLGVTRVLERYRTPFVGKSSPVQFWWGSFDLATTCGIALIMVLAARLHARRKEPGAIAVNVVLLALAVLVAWGASARTPSEPASGYAMRLTVFGGTSPTGQLLIQQALQSGHTVTALARNPTKLAAWVGLTVIQGVLTDTQAIVRAVKDAEAVISLLGPPSKDLGRVDVAPILDGYRNVVAAMKTHGVRRLVALGTPSITDPSDRREPAFCILVAVGKLIQPKAYRTMVGIGQIVRASDLDWTIVRVPLLTDGPRSERINVRTVGDKGGIRLSSANAAAYFLQQAEDTTRFGQAPLITDT